MTIATGIVAVLGIALLMVVHEGGHHLVARAFGMKVLKFSIGMGPPIWRHQPKDSDTVYQVALIPFMAYVQIHGMNPLEDVDPEDKESYANASLIARISAIFAGPLANYLFASVLFFGALIIGGQQTPSLTVAEVSKESPALTAGIQAGDRIVRIEGAQLAGWDDLVTRVQSSPDREIEVVVMREGAEQSIRVTPKKNAAGKGLIGVSPTFEKSDIALGEATERALILPAKMVVEMLKGIGRIITGKEKAELGGPIRIFEESSKAAKAGADQYLGLLGVLSTWLAVFNLLPIPALDGGRLMFLGYEAITRRRANAKVEATVHLVGFALLFMLLLVVSVGDVGRFFD